MILPSRGLRRSDAAHGLTLVELLVTIMIIGILSSSVLFAMSAAQESARKSRTQALIATLHSIIIEKWESYLTRRINLTYYDETFSTGPRAAAWLRLKTIRQMLKIDFPDQWIDVEYMTLNQDPIHNDVTTYLANSYYGAWWSAVNIYLPAAPAITALPSADRAAAIKELVAKNESAECLYAIISFTRATGDRYKLLDSSFIGDTDGDSLPEILDGWGRPLGFVRWPAGFISDLQTGFPGNSTDWANNYQTGWLDHDPFDPMRTEYYAYRMVPLIVSAGPDGLFDVHIVKLGYAGPSTLDMTNRWNPYHHKDNHRAGETWDQNANGTEDWHDNIHNHLINTR
jgi:prepilin-type N-terminal cleavage/methylation domain-containing protein